MQGGVRGQLGELLLGWPLALSPKCNSQKGKPACRLMNCTGPWQADLSLLSMSQPFPEAVVATCLVAGERMYDDLWLFSSASACLPRHDSRTELMAVHVHASQEAWLGSSVAWQKDLV